MLDVSYIMNLPANRIPELLKGLGTPEGFEAQADSWGSLRLPWLEVECQDGLQVATPCHWQSCLAFPWSCLSTCSNGCRTLSQDARLLASKRPLEVQHQLLLSLSLRLHPHRRLTY